MFSASLAVAQACCDPCTAATVYVYPAELNVNVDEVFKVSINVRDVVGLQGFDFMLLYNTYFLDCLAVEEGTFMSSFGQTFVAMRQINESYSCGWGRVWFAAAILCKGWADGNGTLAVLTFKATTAGESVLDLYSDFPYNTCKIKMFTCCADPIENCALDGYVVDDPFPAVPLVGDLNSDGIVDMVDINLVARVYGEKMGEPEYVVDLDLDQSGKVDLCDLLIVAQQFGMRS